MSIGLVLEGGAMRGMYTAGVLDVFLDNDIEVDGIVSVSAGLLFGLSYLSKQRGRTIRYNKKYINDKRYMGIHSLITTGNIVNEKFAFHDIPDKLDIYDEDTFSKSKTKIYATISNVETGKAEYVEIKNTKDQIEVLRASSAMPFVSKMVKINGDKYLDGGICDSIPIEKCIQLGYDKIIVVLTRPFEYRKKQVNKLFTKLKYNKYKNLVNAIDNRYKVYNDTVTKIIDMENKKEIFVIRPSKNLHIKRIEKDIEKLQEMYELGIKDCQDNMIRLKEFLRRD